MIVTLRAMVVDDNPQVVALVREVFKDRNCVLRVATSGDEALQVAASFGPDLVVMSVMVPDQDGWLVCRKLKFGRERPPVVMLTDDSITTRKQRFASFVHADGLVQRPHSERELNSLTRAMETLVSE